MNWLSQRKPLKTHKGKLYFVAAALFFDVHQLASADPAAANVPNAEMPAAIALKSALSKFHIIVTPYINTPQ